MANRYWMCAFMLCFLMLFLTSPVNATRSGPITPTAISIDPGLPTPDEEIQVTLSGVWSNTCAPQYESHQIISRTITINTLSHENEPGAICGQAHTAWEWGINIGMLSADGYAVQVVGAASGTDTFTVVDVRYELFMPVIQTSQ